MIVSKYKKVGRFYLFATLIPWFFWLTAGYVSCLEPYSDPHLRVASGLAFLGLLGPVGVAGWLIGRDRDLRADIKGRIFNFRTAPMRYFVLSAALMPISILSAQAISLLFGYQVDQFQITDHFSFSSGVFPVWFLLIAAPTLEELGWHSYGTDALRVRMNLFNACLVFGLYWGVWHMPLATIRDYYQANLVVEGWIYSVNFLVSIIPFVLIMNWLYYKTGRNLLVPIVFHITAVYFNEIFATHPDSKIIQTGLLLVFTAVIVIREPRFFFSRDVAQLR